MRMTYDKLSTLIGTSYRTNSGKCVIIRVLKSMKGSGPKIVVKFVATGTVKTTRYRQLISKRDGVFDPWYPRVEGVGYVGEGNFNTKDKRLYNLWQSMLHRSCNTEFKKKYPTYNNVKVSDRWKCFQYFAEDVIKMKNWDTPNFELDKDLMFPGKKKYGNKTSSFVPNVINNACKNENAKGMSKTAWGYRVTVSEFGKTIVIGTFHSKKEARKAYITARSNYVKKLAKLYRKDINNQVYNSLMTYEKWGFKAP